MRAPTDVHSDLIELSRWLGADERDCVILGEGNTSACLGDDKLLVKASGTHLKSVGSGDFVTMRRSAVLALLDGPVPQDERAALRSARDDTNADSDPSVETPVHALCLSLPGVRFVGHTHPTAINAITCAVDFDEVLSRQVFADQILTCGPRSLRVPCATPGIALGHTLRDALSGYLDRWGEPPKTIYLRNHGFVALGATANEVKALTTMAIKAATILQGTMAFGGPHDLPHNVTGHH
ncbi:MAG: class II aldolase/adducin family protein [Planctomycetota bacterium]